MDNATLQERSRLQLLETWADPGTVRHLETIGVAPGWRCLEIGVGAGSIAKWLCRRVGSDGSVVATDVDTQLVETSDIRNLQILRHDITTSPPIGSGTFDLVHARMVLEHLPDRERALQHMVASLRPGGWLLLEDQDISSVVAASENNERASLFLDRSAKLVRLLTLAGVDLEFGRHLYHKLRGRLVDVSAEGRVCMVTAHSQLAHFWHLTWESLRTLLVKAGLLTSLEIDEYLDLLDDPGFVWQGPTIMAAWGRLPG